MSICRIHSARKHGADLYARVIGRHSVPDWNRLLAYTSARLDNMHVCKQSTSRSVTKQWHRYVGAV